MFDVREVPGKVIVVYLLASTPLVTLINLVLFPSPFFDPLVRASAGLVDATLQANLLNLLLFGLLLFGWGRLRPVDVGLHWHKLPQALTLTGLLWIGTQGLTLLINALNGEIRLDPSWTERGVTVGLGGLLAQLVGNALFEEIQYRGFYLSQFYQKLKEQSPLDRLAWSILAMVLLFVLSHIPNRIFSGYALADMLPDFVRLFIWGLFFTAVYLVSDNLFLAVGVHALLNRPTLITYAPFPAGLLVAGLALILIIVLGRRKRRAGDQPAAAAG